MRRNEEEGTSILALRRKRALAYDIMNYRLSQYKGEREKKIQSFNYRKINKIKVDDDTTYA